jgi:sulfite reductase (ferredoxin)
MPNPLNALSPVEAAKLQSQGLRGTIREELASGETGFSDSNVHLLKFHGIYQQQDRDERKKQASSAPKTHQFMIRLKNPGGGKLTPNQWLALDDAATRFGNGSLRLTTRQDVQFHGVGKQKLQGLIQWLDQHWMTTYGACGDGARNTLACPVASLRGDLNFNAQAWARKISDSLAFSSTAYYDLWLNGEKINPVTEEPLYGANYLPRKFKIAIALPDDNCVDVLTNDVGIIPELSGGVLEGFHLLIGGGLGSTHGKKETFPRLAEALTFVGPDQLIEVITAVLKTFRDLGDRKNRRHARLKYLVEELGIEKLSTEIAVHLGHPLPSPRNFSLASGHTHQGWHLQKENGLCYLGLFIENGRLNDTSELQLRTGIRKIVEEFRPSILLTPAQDMVLADLKESARPAVEKRLFEFGIQPPQAQFALRQNSMACPAMPTCGLAVAEAERFLPSLIRQLEDQGWGELPVNIRLSGCPNSCSRPPVAEVGIIGRSLNLYHLYVGGSRAGTRLAPLLKSDIKGEGLAPILVCLFGWHQKEKQPGEDFGDWAFRLGIEALQERLTKVL